MGRRISSITGWVAVALSVVLCAAVGGTEPVRDHHLPEVTVAVALDPPLVVQEPDGELTGLAVDLVRMISAAHGLHPRFVRVPEDRLLPTVESGGADMAAGDILATPELGRRVLSTRPYLQGGLVLLHRAGERPREGATLGTEAGGAAQAFARSHLLPGRRFASLRTYPTEEAALSGLLGGEVDAVLMGYIRALPLLTGPFAGRLELERGRFGPRFVERAGIVLCVAPGKAGLRDRLDASILRLERSGLLDELRRQWIHTGLPPDWGRLGRLVAGYGLLALLLLALAISMVVARRRAHTATAYRRLLDQAPFPVFLQHHGTVVLSNEAAHRLLGTRSGERPPTWRLRPAEPDDREVLRRLLEPRREGRREGTLSLITGEGARAVVRASSVPVRFGGRTVIQLALADVTELDEARRELERTVAEQERLLAFQEEVLSTSGALLAEVRPSGRVTLWNRGAERLTGLDERAVNRGTPLWEALAPDEAAAATLARWIEGLFASPGESTEIQIPFRRGDGSTGTLALNGTAPAAAGGDEPRAILLGVDITDQERLRSELEASRRQRTLGRMAGGLAHHFSNILQVVASSADLLRLRMGPSAPNLDLLDSIQSAVDRARSLLSRLLTLARAQRMRMQPVDLGELVRKDLADSVRELVPDSVELRIAAAEGCRTLADPAFLLEALLTLVINAVESIPGEGAVTVTVRCSGTAEAPDTIRIEVADTGPGIEPTRLDSIFDPFFTPSQLLGDTGMGLATVQAIVREHDGTIEVESRPGRGTRFVILLPEYRTPEAARE